MESRRPTFGIETFWESCDRDGVADNPLERELAFRLDALERYRVQIEVADELGDDEAVDVLSRYYDSTSILIGRLRSALQHQASPQISLPGTGIR
jgi:hypothetical protein